MNEIVSRVWVDMKGLDKFKPVVEVAIKLGLYDCAKMLGKEVDYEIGTAGRTGRVYPSKTGIGLHTAAAAGQPISEDTGGTQSDIKIFLDELDQNLVRLGWEGRRADQMIAQELGRADGTMPAHPTLVPVATRMWFPMTVEMQRILKVIKF